MNFGVIVAARTESRRLPGKALLPLEGMPMIIFLLRRLAYSIDDLKIIFATTSLAEDDELASVVAKAGFDVFRGATADVVERFVACAEKYKFEYVVRVTGDCPLLDSGLLKYCICKCREFKHFDLATTKGSFPVGLDFEIYSAELMKILHAEDVLSLEDREHLTKYLYDHADEKGFLIKQIIVPYDLRGETRIFTVDFPEDYEFVKQCLSKVDNMYASVKEMLG